MDEWRRSGQIPAFGNWDMANEMPITQYFESARQAGLVRYSSSSGESDPSSLRGGGGDLYSLDFNKPAPLRNFPPSSTLKKGMRNRERMKEKECNGGKMRKQQGGKVWDVTEQPRKQHLHQNDAVPRSPPHRGARRLANPNPKPVDEDLYKIPPELLRTTKRKKMLGFISKCLVPAACVS